MNYQRIKFFLKAAETLNFSDAARQLYITPQSFGKQIALLEEEMGFPLFERTTRQTRLTNSGKIVYEHLVGRVAGLEKEYQKMCEMGSKLSKQIRIGVFDALSRSKVAMPIVNSVMANYPDQDISIRICELLELKQDLQNGQLDLCVTATHEKEPAWMDCEMIHIFAAPVSLVVSKYHPWYVKDSITLEDVMESNYVKMKMPDALESDSFDLIPCKNKIEVENYETMCLMLEQGNCFCIMYSQMDSYFEKHGKSFPVPWEPFDINLSLIYSKEHYRPFIPELCEFIKEIFEV